MTARVLNHRNPNPIFRITTIHRLVHGQSLITHTRIIDRRKLTDVRNESLIRNEGYHLNLQSDEGAQQLLQNLEWLQTQKFQTLEMFRNPCLCQQPWENGDGSVVGSVDKEIFGGGGEEREPDCRENVTLIRVWEKGKGIEIWGTSVMDETAGEGCRWKGRREEGGYICTFVILHLRTMHIWQVGWRDANRIKPSVNLTLK